MLKEQIQTDTKNAMKAGNSELTSVLRLLSSAISAKEKEKRYDLAKQNPEKPETEVNEEAKLSDQEIISVLSSEVKKRRDSIALYEQGGRPELAENEAKEIAIIQTYLPEQLSADELKKMVADAVAKTGAKEMKDMGKVMVELTPSIKGRADSGEVSKMVKESLGK